MAFYNMCALINILPSRQYLTNSSDAVDGHHRHDQLSCDCDPFINASLESSSALKVPSLPLGCAAEVEVHPERCTYIRPISTLGGP